ncbi:MAG: hypothetical protein A2806_04275 [Candidatus Terrybacteria bacterium RIFCSPHIGHO2_01_FULL_48_17]|uniref:Uncharacterized protein n=1 Tax=Candidatus Terrybacteria bacterium RIFCSPHIGHO2_01_FULL_48_17 TaxID=1802362 RepID=A0A1G2PMQ6_9BACT|nr:MAG: hypothetical protein A2806_04275 [Candidatus Terrybacteria bacterium RIFCSPHIGHO2_01_FULL_48_17]OHA53711.1 MAG: hypothetical protein A3A30_05060 [Candidatus Terrybacteria bacterium RIFCSPLOWO2_01_FULL_48_14]
MTLEEAKQIMTDFVEVHVKTPPFNEYINVVALTDRITAELMLAGRDLSTASAEEMKAQLEGNGENPDMWVIALSVKTDLPPELSLPKEYKGLRVYVCWKGEFVSHGRSRK